MSSPKVNYRRINKMPSYQLKPGEGRLTLTISANQSVQVDENLRIHLVEITSTGFKDGNPQVRICIDCPKIVPINRIPR